MVSRSSGTGQSAGHANIITIERHILEEQRSHPEATGVLTSLLYDIALAGKVIANQTSRCIFRLNEISNLFTLNNGELEQLRLIRFHFGHKLRVCYPGDRRRHKPFCFVSRALRDDQEQSVHKCRSVMDDATGKLRAR